MIRRMRAVPWWSVAAAVLVIATVSALVTVAAVTHREVSADDVDCTKAKCIALTFDDGPTPFMDRLLQVLAANAPKPRSS